MLYVYLWREIILVYIANVEIVSTRNRLLLNAYHTLEEITIGLRVWTMEIKETLVKHSSSALFIFVLCFVNLS